MLPLSITLTLLASASLTAPAREGGVLSAEVSPAAGVLVGGYHYPGGAMLQGWSALGADGWVQLGLAQGPVRSLRLEAGAWTLTPLQAPGPARGTVGVARLGVALGAWDVSLGAYGRVDDTPAPALLLPSLTLAWRPGDFGLALGVLDRPLGAPVRLSLEHRFFGVGLAGLGGLEGWLRLPLGDAFALQLSGFGYQLFSALQAGGSLGLVWRLGASHAGDVS